jgi:general secretion pathway protein G
MRINKLSIRSQQGFTLLELLVVMVILVMLAGLVAPNLMEKFGQAKSKAAKLDIEELSADLDMYKLDAGRYPTTAEGLNALIEAPPSAKSWSGPYLKKKKIPMDPWGNPYHYTAPGQHGKFDLFSLGADNNEGGDGEDADVVGWD